MRTERQQLVDVSKSVKTFGAYFGAPNMVKWGVPEKILQNAVIKSKSKVMTKSNFWPISPL